MSWFCFTIRRWLVSGAMLAIAAIPCAGCSGVDKDHAAKAADGAILTAATTTAAGNAPRTAGDASIALLPPPARPQALAPGSIIIRGSGQFARNDPERRDHTAARLGDISFNFVNADIREVLRSILGDVLKVNYVIDPKVQGVITIQTSQPIDRSAVLPTLDKALKVNSLTLVKRDDVFTVTPMAEAMRHASFLGMGSDGAGFGVRIVPLRYIGAEEMQRLLTPYVAPGGILLADSARNLLALAGSRTELDRDQEIIDVFDVNWLTGMSFGLFTPHYADIKALGEALDTVVGKGSGPLAGMVRIVPLLKLNTILAVSPQVAYLEQVRQWVERLDHGSAADERRLFVYPVQNGMATDLAPLLSRLLNSGKKPADAGGESVGANDDASVTGQSAGGSESNGRTNWSNGGGVGRMTHPTVGGKGRDVVELANGGLFGDADASSGGSSGTLIVADKTNNALVIRATRQEYDVIEEALRRLDIVPLQVLIEAVVAEVDLNNDLRYGVQWFFNKSGDRFTLAGDAAGLAPPALPGFAVLLNRAADIHVALDALAGITNVNVVSTPRMMVLNNRTATIQVGDQVPVASQSAVSVLNSGAPIVNSIQFRDTGVIFKVTPHVNAGGLVTMDVSQEVSDVVPTTTSNLDSPTIQQRLLNSSVAVHSGETVALGGLVRKTKRRVKSGIPYLQDVPVLGLLFGANTDNDDRTELLVLITPKVIRNRDEAREATDELVGKLQEMTPILSSRKPEA